VANDAEAGVVGGGGTIEVRRRIDGGAGGAGEGGRTVAVVRPVRPLPYTSHQALNIFFIYVLIKLV